MLALTLLLAYLAGSIPFSLLIGRWVGGIDLRQHGSGNVGATNVGRVLGWKWGVVALILDALKGVAPTGLLPLLYNGPGRGHLAVGCGVCAILGHMFPCWLKFRGGKGVATSLGVVSMLAPQAALAAFITFAICFAISRIVSLSSMLAGIVFAISEMLILRLQPFTEQNWSLGLFSIVVPLLIIVRHRANIGRLLRHEEKRLTFGTKKTQSPGAAG
jgi:glycerol-3-phosphate acyltransferase PlsY